MNMQMIYTEAFDEATRAFNGTTPVPMLVGQARSLFGNEMVPGTEEFVADGVCGFAWVKIKPARGPFIKFCKQNNIGSKDDYAGGWSINMGLINRASQSMQRKEAAGRAFAKVLQNYGINAWMESRMD